EPPSRGRHAATVSPRIGTCQDLETEDGEPARKVARRGLLDAEHGVAERLQLSVDERLMAAVAAPPVDGLPVGLGHAAVTTRTAIQEDLDVLFRLELAREVLAEADLVSRDDEVVPGHERHMTILYETRVRVKVGGACRGPVGPSVLSWKV